MMNSHPTDVLMEVLGIIGYPGDKFVFIKKFLCLCHYQACWELVGRLSQENQVKIKSQVPSNVSPEALKSLLSAWYEDEDYNKAFCGAVKNIFADCFRSMIGLMNDRTQEKLKQVISQI